MRRTVYCAMCGAELWTDEPWQKAELFFCGDACRKQADHEQFGERLKWMILGDIAGGDDSF